MTARLTLGGPLAIACATCGSPRLHDCHTSGGNTCGPHAARVKGAPPIEEAGAGDLVAVDLDSRSVLALLQVVGEVGVQVRTWRVGTKSFASPRLLPPSAVQRLATPAGCPDDSQTAAARIALARLTP